ncbi:20811_t:CDS:2, partial [Dentiscutata erythropus]
TNKSNQLATEEFDQEEIYESTRLELNESNQETNKSNQQESNDDKKPHPPVKCMYCPKTYDRGIATQMQAHLDNDCQGAPNNAKTKKKNSSQIFENLVFNNNNSITSNLNKPNNFSQKHTRTTFINDFADSMSKKEQEDLKFALAQALFATGVSFSFLENPYVIEFFQKIRPAFKLPSRSKLANELLDKVYKKVKKESDNKIANAQSLLKYFKSHPQSMAKLKCIQQENYSKEISLVLPAITRWGTHFECLQSIKKSKIALEQALMDIRIRENINSDLRNYILSDEFWENLDLLSAILEPIVVTLKQLESDNSTLSSIYFYFKKMVEEICKISCCFSDELNKLVEERWEYTYHPIRMVAYMLDPRFLETNNPSEEAMGYSEFTTFTKEKFGQDESVTLFIELVKFRKKTSPYNNEVIWNSATSFTPSLCKYDTRTDQETNCDNSDSDELFDNGFETNVIDLTANE